MANDSVVRARINSKIKEDATAVLAAIGLTPSDAFRLLMTRVAEEHALPFDLLISCRTFKLHSDFPESFVTRDLSPLPVCSLDD